MALALRPSAYQLDLGRLTTPARLLLGGGLVLAHLPSSAGLPCPLRSLTGVPCPFCGMTTSVRSALGGHLTAAARSAPLGLVVLGVAVLCAVRLAPSRLRVPISVIVPLLAAEWVFELFRFHVL